ncbi:hypothetical protein N0V90_007097 [Kalmusia sp. IMI 367209]|nr:hypothetical protein N0V90_007097 [Kalmusia sp. IMI 367209]
MNGPRGSISPISSRRQSDERAPLSHIPLEEFSVSRTPSQASLAYSRVQQNDKANDDDRSAQKPMPRFPIKKQIPQFDWWWEVAAVIIAVTSTGAIIAVLRYASGKAVLDWSFSIQPASLVAIFSTIAKSALVVPLAASLSQLKWRYFERPRTLSHMQDFDDASRGPMGAMLLLWKVKGTALLSSVAAAVTLLMLAFEPFTQQVIRFDTRPLEVIANSKYNTTFEYKPATMRGTASLSDWQFYGGADPDVNGQFSLTIGMMASMAGRPSTFTSNMYCPTSECSFSDMTTLGARSVCESEKLLVNDKFGCKYYVRESVPDSSRGNETVYNELKSFRVAAESAAKLDTTLGYGMNCSRSKEGFPAIGLTLYMDTVENTTHLHGLGQQRNQTSTNLAPDAIFGDTNNTFMGIVDLSPNGTFNSSFHQSRYRFCTSGFDRKGLGGNSEDFDTIDTFTCFLTSHTTPYGTVGNFLDELETYNTTLTHCRLSYCARTYKKPKISNGELKTESIIERMLIKTGENTYNDTEVIAPWLEGSNFTALIGPKTTANLASTIELVAYSTSFQKFIQNLVDVTDWPVAFDRIAATASDFIRSTDNVNAGEETGQVLAPETFIKVRWVWITLPLFLLAMSIAVLISTMITSRGRQLSFKHSVLAPLLHPLASGQAVEFQTASGGRQTDSGLRKTASGIKASIITDPSGRRIMERSG